jgi:hypothetical protein
LKLHKIFFKEINKIVLIIINHWRQIHYHDEESLPNHYIADEIIHVVAEVNALDDAVIEIQFSKGHFNQSQQQLLILPFLLLDLLDLVANQIHQITQVLDLTIPSYRDELQPIVFLWVLLSLLSPEQLKVLPMLLLRYI